MTGEQKSFPYHKWCRNIPSTCWEALCSLLCADRQYSRECSSSWLSNVSSPGPAPQLAHSGHEYEWEANLCCWGWMAQWLRAITALLEDQSFIPSTMSSNLQSPITSSRGSNVFFWPPHTHGIDSHSVWTHTYVIKKYLHWYQAPRCLGYSFCCRSYLWLTLRPLCVNRIPFLQQSCQRWRDTWLPFLILWWGRCCCYLDFLECQ